MSVRVVQLIYCNSERAGTGKDENSPIRILEQLWTMDGALICQYDPCSESENPKQVEDHRTFIVPGGIGSKLS
jgi:hypothetical protein